jgi:hypothetical protein
MKIVFIFFIFLFLNNCSLNKDSKYLTDEDVSKSKNQKKLSQISEKANDIINMTYDEYIIYIDRYTKKSKYPDINQ